jgi:hypothetical protein
VATAAFTVLAALQPTLSLDDEGRTVANPIGVSGLPDPDQGVVGAVNSGLFTAVSLAACASLVLRFAAPAGRSASSSSGWPTRLP